MNGYEKEINFVYTFHSQNKEKNVSSFRMGNMDWDVSNHSDFWRLTCRAPQILKFWSHKVTLKMAFKSLTDVAFACPEVHTHRVTETSRDFDYPTGKLQERMATGGGVVQMSVTVTLAEEDDVMEEGYETPYFTFAEKWLPDQMTFKFIVEGRKLYANRHIVAKHSTFFNELVGSSPNDEAELDKVTYHQFHELLGLIHGFDVIVHGANVSDLVNLSSRYSCMHVFARCTKVLLQMKDVDFITKISIAEFHHLPRLMKQCLDDFEQLSDGQKREILDNLEDEEMSDQRSFIHTDTAFRLAKLCLPK